MSGWRDVAVRVWREIGRDRLVLASAGVAFFAFLSLIPAIAVLVSVAGLVLDPDTVATRTEDILEPLPEEARQLLVSQLEAVAGQASGALSVSLMISALLALWSASSGVGHVIQGVNLAYDEHDDRGFVARRALALVFTLGAVVFITFVIGGLTALPAITGGLDLPSWARALTQIAFWVAIAIGFAIGLGLLYRYGPDREPVRWRWITWGSAIALALWILASFGFRLYVTSFGSYEETYGSLAAVAVLLTWLLITALTVLLGAEINAQLENQTTPGTVAGRDEQLAERARDDDRNEQGDDEHIDDRTDDRTDDRAVSGDGADQSPATVRQSPGGP